MRVSNDHCCSYEHDARLVKKEQVVIVVIVTVVVEVRKGKKRTSDEAKDEEDGVQRKEGKKKKRTIPSDRFEVDTVGQIHGSRRRQRLRNTHDTHRSRTERKMSE